MCLCRHDIRELCGLGDSSSAAYVARHARHGPWGNSTRAVCGAGTASADPGLRGRRPLRPLPLSSAPLLLGPVYHIGLAGLQIKAQAPMHSLRQVRACARHSVCIEACVCGNMCLRMCTCGSVSEMRPRSPHSWPCAWGRLVRSSAYHWRLTASIFLKGRAFWACACSLFWACACSLYQMYACSLYPYGRRIRKVYRPVPRCISSLHILKHG